MVFFNRAIHPGNLIKSELEEREISQKELAIRLGVSEKHLSEVINGKKGISPSFANGLEDILEIPASLWLKLQRKYEDNLKYLQYKDSFSKSKILQLIYNNFIKFFQKEGFFNFSDDKFKALIEFSKIIGIKDLNNLPKLYNLAFKKTNYKGDNDLTKIWILIGKFLSEKINLENDFSKENISQLITEIKEKFFNKEEINIKALQQLFAKYGIKFIFLPTPSKVSINGVSLWYKNSPLIILGNKGKKIDTFWFNVFHELGHLALHLDEKNQKIYVDYDNGYENSKEEEQANIFALENIDNNIKHINSKDEAIKYISNHPNSHIIAGICAYRLKDWKTFSKFRKKLKTLA